MMLTDVPWGIYCEYFEKICYVFLLLIADIDLFPDQSALDKRPYVTNGPPVVFMMIWYQDQ